MFDFNNNGKFDAFDAFMLNEIIADDESKKDSKRDSLDSDVPVRRYSDDSDDPVRRCSDDSDDIDIGAADTFDMLTFVLRYMFITCFSFVFLLFVCGLRFM